MLRNNANTNCLQTHEGFRRCVWTFRVIIYSKITKVHKFLTGENMLNLTVAFCPCKGGPDLCKQQCCRIATMITKEKLQRRQGTGHTTTRSHVALSPKQDDGYGMDRQYFFNENMTTASGVDSFRNSFPVIVAFSGSSNRETQRCSIRNFRHLGK